MAAIGNQICLRRAFPALGKLWYRPDRTSVKLVISTDITKTFYPTRKPGARRPSSAVCYRQFNEHRITRLAPKLHILFLQAPSCNPN